VVFDPRFYESVLPDRVRQQCVMQPGHVPVVEFRLTDGTLLDVCHIVHLDEKWLAVAFFRDASSCQDMDLALFGYELVTRVILSMHDPHSRSLGFQLDRQPQASQIGRSDR